jgi:multidrug efflux pump subunit AcrB
MFFIFRPLLLSLALLLASCATSQNSLSQVVVVETVVATQDANEIERLVTVPLERAIHALTGFARTESQTSPGSVRVEVYYIGSPSPEAVKEVESAVLAEWAKFSTLASKPMVFIRSNALP